MTISTRQNRNGNWWCNLTAKGYGDVSFEGKNIKDAQDKMLSWMNSLRTTTVYDCAIWEEPVPYENIPSNPYSSSDIGYSSSRIDNNPIG